MTERGRLTVIKADITKLDVDAVVNAANEALAPGAGVDGAIRRAAGPAINAATRAIGGCPTGEARMTRGYDLPAKWVIHTVGPVWRGGDKCEPTLLACCYRASLELASRHGFKRVAFPAISTGVYGFPRERAATIAVREIRAFLARDEIAKEILLVAFSDADRAAFDAAIADFSKSGE